MRFFFGSGQLGAKSAKDAKDCHGGLCVSTQSRKGEMSKVDILENVMAELAYLLLPIEMDRALFLDTLECILEDGALTRSQVKTLSMLSAHRLPCMVDMQQRTLKGAVLATFGTDQFTVTRAGNVSARDT